MIRKGSFTEFELLVAHYIVLLTITNQIQADIFECYAQNDEVTYM